MTPKSAAVRAVVLFLGLVGIGSCADREASVLVTITGDSTGAQSIEVTPWLGGRIGELRTLPSTQRLLVLRVPEGLCGALSIETEAVDSEGCTLGRGSTEIFVEPGFIGTMPASVNLNPMVRAQCFPRMIQLPPGTFVMGSPPTEMYHNAGEQQHQVRISTAFAMSETEVSQMQYQRLMGANLSYFRGDPKRPVDSVSWLDAIKYCNQLSLMEQLPPCYEIDAGENVSWDQGLKCRGYRLPTEAEWEYAARANTAMQYAGSDNLDEVGWHIGNSRDSTHAVRTKQKNPWSLFDLSGNVHEWVWDWHSDYPMASQVSDPMGAQSGSSRVVRGGSYASQAQFVRVANRLRYAPYSREKNLGFRLARSYP